MSTVTSASGRARTRTTGPARERAGDGLLGDGGQGAWARRPPGVTASSTTSCDVGRHRRRAGEVEDHLVDGPVATNSCCSGCGHEPPARRHSERPPGGLRARRSRRSSGTAVSGGRGRFDLQRCCPTRARSCALPAAPLGPHRHPHACRPLRHQLDDRQHRGGAHRPERLETGVLARRLRGDHAARRSR